MAGQGSPQLFRALRRRTVAKQGYYRDGQRVVTPIGASEPWVLDLGKREFKDLVAEVRQIATSD